MFFRIVKELPSETEQETLSGPGSFKKYFLLENLRSLWMRYFKVEKYCLIVTFVDVESD